MIFGDPHAQTLAPAKEKTKENTINRYLEATTGLVFTDGNQIQKLRNGCQIFPAMLKAIEEARKSILFETYVYWTGEIAERFSSALASKAKEGVTVKVLLDAYGASRMSKKNIRKMKKAGVKVRWFRPLRLRFWDYDKRTHRKILVCDDRIGFTGGVGIAKEWEGDARNENEWRETHFRIEGPAVAGLCGAFWNNWIDIDGEWLPDPERQNQAATRPGHARALVAKSSPATHQSEMELIFESLIHCAQQSLCLTTPYFNIRQRTRKLIRKRASEGVKVTILLPGDKIDKSIELPVADDSIRSLIDHPNITFYRYQRSMIHAKVIRVDERLCCIGSPNFNQRSRKKDFEIAMIVDDFELAQELDEDFQDDLTLSEQLDPASLRTPTLLQRLKQKLSLLFKEQL